jgi:peptidoglycan/xylan/chitin deacetylase (PgdA/CDA1 family)
MMPIKRLFAKGMGRARQFHSAVPRTVVLCYHSTAADRIYPGSCPPDVFEQHVEWLTRNCDVADPRRSFRMLRADGSRPTVVITFDDGFADNFDYAFPVLVKHGVKAAFFLTGGSLTTDPPPCDALSRIYRGPVRTLEWSQIREMHDAGFTFGAHTVSHPNLARLPEPLVARELLQSKEILEDGLGAPITSVAYPFGRPRRHYTHRTLRMARELGFKNGFTTVHRGVTSQDDPLATPRISVGSDTIDLLREKVWGDWDFLGWWHERAPRFLADTLSPKGRRSASGAIDHTIRYRSSIDRSASRGVRVDRAHRLPPEQFRD